MIEQSDSIIEWEELKDLHIQGRCGLGRIVIRTDRQGSVSGVYTKFGPDWEKWVPEQGEVVSESMGKGMAQTLANSWVAAKRLAQVAGVL